MRPDAVFSSGLARLPSDDPSWPPLSHLAFVLEQLAAVRNVVTKRTVGGIGICGIGIYSGEAFFAAIDNDTPGRITARPASQSSRS